MTLEVRRVVLAAVAAGTLAATAVSVPSLVGTLSAQGPSVPEWTPVTSGLTAAPAELLPERISVKEPVDVVTTTVDATGRPVVTTRHATDREHAEELVRAGQQTPGAVAVELDATARALAAPTGTDQYANQQWSLPHLGISPVWQRSTGAGVTVAVLDSGVDASHPDLAGQLLPGIDFTRGGAPATIDENGHGTHVAGTIAALTGNGIGVAGVAPDARILPVRVLGANGTGSMSDVASGIVYATDQGAQVINMSLGTPSRLASVSNAIAYARSQGVTVVASAGNARTTGSPVNYPAADPGVIGVAATDDHDAYTYFSTQGPFVDVAAPGLNILSTVPLDKGTYAFKSGTSMAAPHVAAVAALLKSADPTLTPDEIQNALESTAVDAGAPGKDTDYGWGVIDPAAALASAVPASAPTTPPTTPPTTAPATTPPTTPPATTPPTTAPTTPPTSAPSVTPTSSAPTVVPAPSAAPTTPPVAPSPVPSDPAGLPTPGVTKSPVRATPVVAARTTARTVNHGATSTSTFTVTAAKKPWANQRASVCVAGPTGPFTCTATTTAADGTVRYSRPVTGRYSVRLVVSATTSSPQVSSDTVTFQPRAVVALAKAGKTLTGNLDGAAGQTVRLQRLDGRNWVNVASYRAVKQRTFSGLRAGSSYRLVVPTVPAVTGATSATVRL